MTLLLKLLMAECIAVGATQAVEAVDEDHARASGAQCLLYIRQSTTDQLLNNPESRRRQYALAARARSLGWEDVNRY